MMTTGDFGAMDVTALREETGCGLLDCKRALEKANGDYQKAIEMLRVQGRAIVIKAGRLY